MISGPAQTVKRARKLRKSMSLPEVVLWRELRKRPGNYKFRRQHPAGPYILDFFCAQARLAIEVDGKAHEQPLAKQYDKQRSRHLSRKGIATTRIPAILVLDNVDPVITRLVEICNNRIEMMETPLHQLSAGPPPHAGEDCI